MIVLTQQQRDFLMDFKKPFQSILDDRHIDFLPIPIKNNLYILPENLLNDEGFKEVKDALGDHLKNMVTRDVLADEFINYTLA
jgi:hypothetical protein